jgi:fumarate reductase subunit D
MKLIRLLEPLWWMLFGAGGFAAAMVLPALLLVVGLAFPWGWFGDPTTTFHRMHTLFGNPVGQLVLIAVFVLTFWHSAHHLRHFALDMGMHHLELPVSYALYGAAALGSLATIRIVLAL